MSKVLGGLKVTHITFAYANTDVVISHAGLRRSYQSLFFRVAHQAHLDANASQNSIFITELDYLD